MFIEVEGARLFFDCVGPQLAVAGEAMDERPTLVVLHGGPGFDHSTLRPYFDRFADTHQVLYLDHRGNGRSGGGPETWNLRQWGRDVKALCDALGIQRPHVYGNSFGGFVALAYAAQFPDHPGKLILSSTAARTNLAVTYRMIAERGGAKARKIAEAFWGGDTGAAMEDYVRVCLPLYNPKPNPDHVEARNRAIFKPEVLQHFVLGELRRMDARAGLSKLQCPTLVITGRHDPVTPPECAEELAQIIKGSELHILEEAGHGVHRDAPQRAEKIMRSFLTGDTA
jgi:proline iminopeptidase